MTKTELIAENKQLKILLGRNLFWARRYGHGRSTYCPSMVREDIKHARKLGVIVGNDDTIKPPGKWETQGMRFREDFLDDTLC